MSDHFYSNDQFRTHFAEVKPRVTKAYVMHLAVKSSEENLKVQALGMLQVPSKTEERVMHDAQYRIARSIADAAGKAYDDAMSEWIARGQPE